MWRITLATFLFIPVLVAAQSTSDPVQTLEMMRTNINQIIEELKRIPVLESENVKLRAENDQLKATVDDLRAKLASSQEEASTATSTLIDVLNKMTKIIGDTAAHATPVSVRPAIDLPIVPSPKPPRG